MLSLVQNKLVNRVIIKNNRRIMNQELVMSPHLLVAFLQKPASEWSISCIPLRTDD